jgi:Xaa-Pro aminopeptidase
VIENKIILEKSTQVEDVLKSSGIDCWITFTRESQVNGDPVLDYILGSHVTWPSAFIFTAKGESIALVGQYDVQTVTDSGVYNRIEGYISSFKEPFLKIITEIKPENIALNYSRDSEICDGLTHGLYLYMSDLLALAGFQERIVSAVPVVRALIEIKTVEEMKYIQMAVDVTEEIFRIAADSVHDSTTEFDIARTMQTEVDRRKLEFAWEMKTCPSVFTGPDTAEAHYIPTSRMIEPGHLFSMDFGVKVSGYCSDIQRTYYAVAPGEKSVPQDVQRAFDIIVTAIESARRTIRPGITGEEVDRVARDLIVTNGYAEFPAGLGHQVGRYAHDGTALLGPRWEKYGIKPTLKLAAGMVFTIEPRVSVPGHGIVTIEEMVVITDQGARFLSTPQKEIRVISLQSN